MGNGKNINPEHAKTIFDLYKVDPVAAKTLCKQYGYKKSSFYKLISLEEKSTLLQLTLSLGNGQTK